MQNVYQKTKHQIQSMSAIDKELPWLLTLDLLVIVAAIGLGVGGIA